MFVSRDAKIMFVSRDELYSCIIVLLISRKLQHLLWLGVDVHEASYIGYAIEASQSKRKFLVWIFCFVFQPA